MTFTVRTAGMADLPRLVALSRITQTEHAARLPDHFSEHDDPFSTQIYRRILKGELEGAIFVATRGELILGHAGFHIWPFPAPENRHARVATVLDLTIDPEHRGQGLGRVLLDRLLDAARQAGATSVHAQVWRENPASAALFETSGFDRSYTEFRLGLAPALDGPPPVPGKPVWPIVTLLGLGMAAAAAAFATR